MSENLIGKVARCKRGILGIISHRVTNDGKESYLGVSLAGKLWMSFSPEIVADSISEYYENIIVEDRKQYASSIRTYFYGKEVTSQVKESINGAIKVAHTRSLERSKDRVAFLIHGPEESDPELEAKKEIIPARRQRLRSSVPKPGSWMLKNIRK